MAMLDRWYSVVFVNSINRDTISVVLLYPIGTSTGKTISMLWPYCNSKYYSADYYYNIAAWYYVPYCVPHSIVVFLLNEATSLATNSAVCYCYSYLLHVCIIPTEHMFFNSPYHVYGSHQTYVLFTAVNSLTLDITSLIGLAVCCLLMQLNLFIWLLYTSVYLMALFNRHSNKINW